MLQGWSPSFLLIMGHIFLVLRVMSNSVPLIFHLVDILDFVIFLQRALLVFSFSKQLTWFDLMENSCLLGISWVQYNCFILSQSAPFSAWFSNQSEIWAEFIHRILTTSYSMLTLSLFSGNHLPLIFQWLLVLQALSFETLGRKIVGFLLEF